MLMYGVNGEALQLHAVYKNATSHVHASEPCNEIEGSYDKIIYHHSTKLYWKKPLVCCH